MSHGWRIFIAVAVSVATQGVLAPVAIYWLIRHYQQRAPIRPRRRSNRHRHPHHRRPRNA